MLFKTRQSLFNHRHIKDRIKTQRTECNIHANFDPYLCFLWREHKTSTLNLSSADNLCKQFGTRSGPTNCRAWSGSKLFDTVGILKRIFWRSKFWKNLQTTKYHENYPACKELRLFLKQQGDWSIHQCCWFWNQIVILCPRFESHGELDGFLSSVSRGMIETCLYHRSKK